MRIKRGSILMAGGLALLLAALCLTGYNLWDGKRAAGSVESAMQALEAQTPVLEELNLPKEMIPDYVLNPWMPMPVMEIDGREYVGYIEIPALELSLPVLSEWSYPNLKVSPCRYSGSVYLNSMVIAAHNYERHFGGLKYLEPGDAVSFTDADGNVFHYVVSGLEQLDPKEPIRLWEGEWDLTLFTCTIGGQYRVTVRCVRTEDVSV
ncbi:MAG: sortase [Oscillibacter sp.]|nr:sortase [Oscillibacter sp.]